MKKPTEYSSKNKGTYTLLRSFSFAFQGVIYALVTERNLRIHCFVAAFVIYATRYYTFTKAEKGLLILIIGLVITCELFNTAIENAIDLESPDYNYLAKIAKDVAAGAVLVSSIASVIVGIVLFWDTVIIKQIAMDVLKYFYIWIPIVTIAIIVIFLPELNLGAQNTVPKKEDKSDENK